MSTQPPQVIACFLLDSIEREHQVTRKVLAALPEGKLSWRPDPKGRSAGELAWHIAHSEVWFLEAIAAGQFAAYTEPKAPERVADILSYYQGKLPAALAKLRALTPEHFAQILTYAGAFSFPAFAYLMLTVSHSIHHRGQLSAYLRAMGEKVPAIYGGSADEPWAPPAEAAEA
jgi:uncharacterized damage-inducible protein DinB